MMAPLMTHCTYVTKFEALAHFIMTWSKIYVTGYTIPYIHLSPYSLSVQQILIDLVH